MASSTGTGRRRPWVAAILGFVWPGVGYLYAGRLRVGASLLLAYQPIELVILLLAVVIPAAPINVVVPAGAMLMWRIVFARGAAAAARAVSDGPTPVPSRWYGCLTAMAVTVLPNFLWASGYRTAFVQAFEIPTGAMLPTIAIGDHLLAVKWPYGWRDPVTGRGLFGMRRPERGELVVFRFPEDRSRVFIKRCIGLPGETVAIRGRDVLINGKPLVETYTRFLKPPPKIDGMVADPEDPADDFGPVVVPADAYFVLGDNRDNSRDSRYWGFLPHEDLLGRATVIYWSQDANTGHIRWERIGQRLR